MTSLTTGEDALVALSIAVASGKRSKSDLSGVGEEEFAPWIIAGDVGSEDLARRRSR